MHLCLRRAALVAALAALAAPAAAPAGDRHRGHDRDRSLRVATFNASLNRNAEGELIANLSTPANAQASAVAEVIQRVRPDVLKRSSRCSTDARATSLWHDHGILGAWRE